MDNPRTSSYESAGNGPDKSVMFFLGSGVSFAAGYPCVNKITQSLMHDTWEWTNRSCLYRVSCANANEHPSPDDIELRNAMAKTLPEKARTTQCDQEFLRFIANDAREIGCKQVTYETLYDVCSDLDNLANGIVDSPMARHYAKHLQTIINEKMPADAWHQNPSEFIRQVVIYWTSKPREPKGLYLLREAVADTALKQIDIVTLNHDCNIERSLKSWGFDFDQGLRPTNNRLLMDFTSLAKSTQRIRLLKLHGSADACVSIDPVACQCWPSTAEATAKQQALQLPLAIGHDLLIGTMSKLIAYNFAAADAVLVLRLWLSQHRNIIISGYGWRDLAVNAWLLDWLDRKGNRCSLLHNQRLDTIMADLIDKHKRPFQESTESGALRHVDKWFQDSHWSEIESLIQ
jgi:hypothetical protein